MKNAIILHGKPDKEEYYDPTAPSMSNTHWLPWLQAQLLKVDIAAATPEVPLAFDPYWPTWIKEVERFEITPETILIGHSTGGGFFIKYLSIHPEVRVGKVIVVAPWLDPNQDQTKNFFDDFEIDPNLVSRTAGITIFHSHNDAVTGVHQTVEILRAKVKGIKYKAFQDHGHFTSMGMKTTTFPALLEEILA